MDVKSIPSMFAGERERFYNGLAYPVIVETGRHPTSGPKVVRLPTTPRKGRHSNPNADA